MSQVKVFVKDGWTNEFKYPPISRKAGDNNHTWSASVARTVRTLVPLPKVSSMVVAYSVEDHTGGFLFLNTLTVTVILPLSWGTPLS